ncbi:MAG: sugar ABC transporter permease [Rhodobacteraceae bacterium]|uniref:carbohydrate ABC transporter permease n=1 Tax=Salipiger TaxID=263377 RepID=UPI0008E0D7E0|nr:MULTISPECIES: sugar ABC transporter permease [Salipiger]MAB09043.1 sugar ABC transporter permease [Paracoccaceae bacterium]GGA28109.1 ABC transporter permease [Salipiger profundus]SFC76616.1 carbohydrate ABC transporter membrane protein 1, CUT1 family [Salipiger profundus]
MPETAYFPQTIARNGDKPRILRPERRQARAGAALVTPAVVLLVLILLVPVAVAAVLSFSDYTLGRPGLSWVGLDNYTDIFTRTSYTKMVMATVLYVLVTVPTSVGLGLGAALLIRSVRIGSSFYRTVYFLPVMASLLAMAIVWEFALHPSLGLVNRTLEQGCGTLLEVWPWFARGCANGFPMWLSDRDYALWTLAFIGIWQSFGFNMVLYLAGLTGVPRDLYAAAEMDGVRNGWERFRLITWPMLGPTTVFVVTISTIRSFQVFDTVEALTHGGPAKSTYVMIYAIYEKGIAQNLVGVGAAITILFLGFVMLISVAQRRFVERKVHYA